MSLAGGRRTKTGAWSTDAAALEELAVQGHDLPRKVLDWRLLAKLKSTYTDAIPAYIHPETGRVHTTYALAASTTGRLSSVEPNLQNIPVRTAEGRAIRKAFVADKGKKLISADYSQIELRVLAHMADTPTLRQAFADGLDIHAMTASEMFGVPIEGMDPNDPPPRQGDQFRHRLRHLRGRAWPPSSASPGARPAPISRPISSASPASATIWRR